MRGLHSTTDFPWQMGSIYRSIRLPRLVKSSAQLSGALLALSVALWHPADAFSTVLQGGTHGPRLGHHATASDSLHTMRCCVAREGTELPRPGRGELPRLELGRWAVGGAVEGMGLGSGADGRYQGPASAGHVRGRGLACDRGDFVRAAGSALALAGGLAVGGRWGGIDQLYTLHACVPTCVRMYLYVSV
jgi:hypothetical protein